MFDCSYIQKQIFSTSTTQLEMFSFFLVYRSVDFFKWKGLFMNCVEWICLISSMGQNMALSIKIFFIKWRICFNSFTLVIHQAGLNAKRYYLHLYSIALSTFLLSSLDMYKGNTGETLETEQD